MTEPLPIGRRLVECGYPPVPLAVAGPSLAGVVRGRYPSHGYIRGWGLERGGLDEAISAHPLFQEAFAASHGRSLVTEERLKNLFMIVACYFDTIADHNIAEFGSYKGGSALFMAYLLKRLYPGAVVYAHDTFEGMPDVDQMVDRHVKGDFADPDFAGLQRLRDELGLDNLRLVQGLVQDTFPHSIPATQRLGLAHFDMDIYEPTVFAQTVAWPFMTKGAYYVYDDATVPACIGATQAVEELVLARKIHSEQVFPHFVFRVGLEG